VKRRTVVFRVRGHAVDLVARDLWQEVREPGTSGLDRRGGVVGREGSAAPRTEEDLLSLECFLRGGGGQHAAAEALGFAPLGCNTSVLVHLRRSAVASSSTRP